MSQAKSECESLLNVVLPFTEELLVKYQEFFPFAAAMDRGGGVAHVAGYPGGERPLSADVIAILKDTFRSNAAKGEYRATALAYDVRVPLPANGVKTDAIAVELDHEDDYSVIVYFPYTIVDGEVSIGEAFAQQGAAEIFRDPAKTVG